MICRSMLACVLCAVALSPSAYAEEPAGTLEQLRQRHREARDLLAGTENPDLGAEGFREKLMAWSEAHQKSQESARALIHALLDHWITLPEDSAELSALCKEIKTVSGNLAGTPQSEQYNNAKSFLARAVWPLLADDELTRERAAFLLELTEPQQRVRMEDKMARRGLTTEANGWDVQAAHALALIRSGKDIRARDEITILQQKVSINHKVLPRGSLDYGPEAGEARWRSYTDYLQLCEILHGLRAAISEDHEVAAQRIEQARQLRNALTPEASLLIAEIGRRAEAGHTRQQTPGSR